MLELYALNDDPPTVRPGQRHRDWMTPHAYRCLPLAAANELGWDVLLPHPVTIDWDGGEGRENLTASCPAPDVVESNFGHGIFTFGLGHIWKTAPGWGAMFTGVPNGDLAGLSALTGVVETDKLDYPVFMSYRMAAPGRITLAAGTPICRVIPLPLAEIRAIEPSIRSAAARQEVDRPHRAFAARRDRHKAELRDGTARRPWLGHYQKMADHPTTRCAAPRDLRGAEELAEAGIFMRDDYLSADACKTLIALIKETPAGDVPEPHWRDMIVRPAWPDTLRPRLTDEVKAAAAAFYGGGAFTQTNLHAVLWRKGKSMPAHDDYGAEGEFPHRDYAAILYLNDDFEGGWTEFPALGFAIEPRAGSLIIFPGGGPDGFDHGVTAVTKGTRHTIISWLSPAPE